jgi:GAF domain-containing protein
VPLPRPNGFSARVAQTKQPLIINEADSHAFFQTLQARAWALKAIAGFPIIKSDRVIAVMNVVFLEPHRFTRVEEEALLGLSDHAAIAIDNAQLYHQVQRKIQELSALNAVTQSAAQITDISAMLNDALGAVLSAVSAGATLVAILNSQKNVLELAAHRGLTTTVVNEFKAHPLKVGEGFGGTVAQTGKPQFVADASKDERRLRRNTLESFASIFVARPAHVDRDRSEFDWRDCAAARGGDSQLVALSRNETPRGRIGNAALDWSRHYFDIEFARAAAVVVRKRKSTFARGHIFCRLV